jgi:hypothetical protein
LILVAESYPRVKTAVAALLLSNTFTAEPQLSRSTHLEAPIWRSWTDALPKWPLCCNAFDDGVYRRGLPEALTHQHVQLNTNAFTNWLVFDIDRDDSFEAWERANVHPPNAYIQNPDNGHGHLLYALAAPVGMGDCHRSAPINFAAAIQRGMTRRLGADAAYANRLAKNPLHERWRTSWMAPQPFALTTLLEPLDRADMRHSERSETAGISRNCDLFNELRRFAYRNVLAYKDAANLDAWRGCLFNEACALNVFALPLATSELRSIASSVAKWTWRNFGTEQYRERFVERQRARARQRWDGHVAASTTKPWEAEGIGRATWYSRRQVKL